ncbi:SUN domain-containing protein 5 [Nilaparvata lugens]|uniref:SUN domain-containing protein 5 n=1 Tax=Nilaparvata lugens TaxID=108931 RepID=UPI00193DA26F|nr:SUN domain-containing protein 5 [Nilaparvata lugens]
MSSRRLTMGLRNEYSQPPCLNLSKLRKRISSKSSLENGNNLSKKNQSPCGSNFSGCSETAVISFGCDISPDSIPKKKKGPLKGYGDGKELIENDENSPDIQASVSNSRVNSVDQETQTDVPSRPKGYAKKIKLLLISLLVFFCCTQIDFLQIIEDLHDEYFSRLNPSEALLIDNGNTAAPTLFLEDMAQLQAKVETLEKALVLLQQPKAMQINRAADKMIEQLYGPMPDYALEATGGSIIDTPNTQTYSSSGTLSIFGFDFWKEMVSHPRLLIKGLIQPGECWTFKGTVGSVVIQLSLRIKVSSITLEHFPDHLLPSGRPTLSAPKIFSVIAVPDCENCKPKHLGLFEYNLFGPARQTFIVGRELFESMPGVRIIEIHFTANHGNPVFTCVYRVRIHGEPHPN